MDEVNPDPQRIIPIAWSVSSGNNYLLDYREDKEAPSVLVMEHELAMVREDAESEAETLEDAQQLMEENVKSIAAHSSHLRPFSRCGHRKRKSKLSMYRDSIARIDR